MGRLKFLIRYTSDIGESSHEAVLVRERHLSSIWILYTCASGFAAISDLAFRLDGLRHCRDSCSVLEYFEYSDDVSKTPVDNLHRSLIPLCFDRVGTLPHRFGLKGLHLHDICA